MELLSFNGLRRFFLGCLGEDHLDDDQVGRGFPTLGFLHFGHIQFLGKFNTSIFVEIVNQLHEIFK